MTIQSSKQPGGSHTYHLACWLFLRLIGLCFLFAFISAFFQLPGLIGSDGILPVQLTLEQYRLDIGSLAWLAKPTICWLNGSDAMLNALAVVGILLSLSVMVGIFTGPALLLACLFYGSIVNVGGDFFAFQWDRLLLEAGVLSLFLLTPWRALEPPLGTGGYRYCHIVVWLLRWLLFRVMFCSGAVKLLSGCPLWRNLTGLSYYYQNQLLPNPVAWYAHQLPAWLHTVSLVSGLFLELVVPFCMFAPRKLRLAGAVSIMLLQAVMALTGNHGFINFLTIVLCIPLLDDAFLMRFAPSTFASKFDFAAPTTAPTRLYRVAANALAGVVLSVTTVQFAQTLGGSAIFPRFVRRAMSTLRAYHVVGGYGLYPWVYRQRTELVVEGSNDLKLWRPYAFKFKLGDIGRAPPMVAPYQPRLDWLMRFAALTPPSQCVWFRPFVDSLLVGSPAVLKLMDDNPFPDHPPRYIRVNVYTYSFTNWAQKQATGHWWNRRLQGTYLDATALK